MGAESNGAAPVPSMIQRAPLPTAWGIHVGMLGDKRVVSLNFETPQGSSSFFVDEDNAKAMRDRLTQILSGLVLP
jgi:hypothetical protein